jgi:hypothetical protein
VVTVRNNLTGATTTQNVPNTPTAVNSAVISGLTNGTSYRFSVRGVNAAGLGATSTAINVTPSTVPGRPGILAPTQGAAGGTLTANANWEAPTSNGGATITSYRVTALRMQADGVTPVDGPPAAVATVGGTARTRAFALPAGNYRFEVVAINVAGASAPSERSNLIAPR